MNVVVDKNDVEKMIEKYIENESTIQPVSIDNFYDAGFISPDGLVYAMRGQVSDLIHLQLADELFKIYDIKINEKSFSKDYILMSEGWIKFHTGEIHYYGHEKTNLNSFGWKTRIPSKKQLDILDKYAIKHCNGNMSINGKLVNINDTPTSEMNTEELEKLFEF